MALLVQCRKGAEEMAQRLDDLLSNKKKQDPTKRPPSELYVKRMEAVATALEVSLSSVELSNELQPVRVLGVNAEVNVAMSIFTTVSSFFIYVGSTLFSTESSGV